MQWQVDSEDGPKAGPSEKTAEGLASFAYTTHGVAFVMDAGTAGRLG